MVILRGVVSVCLFSVSFCVLTLACAVTFCERSTNVPPPPPPPPPPPAPVPIPVKTDTMKSSKSAVSGNSELHDELRVVLPQIQQRQRTNFDIKKTPDIFIHQKSNPDEVVEWLEAKGFSSAAQRALRVPGHALFALSRAELEAALGADEGKRLYSQVLVQRNVSGYKTTSASELQSILRKVREKVEVS